MFEKGRNKPDYITYIIHLRWRVGCMGYDNVYYNLYQLLITYKIIMFFCIVIIQFLKSISWYCRLLKTARLSRFWCCVKVTNRGKLYLIIFSTNFFWTNFAGILYYKTPPAAYGVTRGVFYLLEKRSIEFYNVASIKLKWTFLYNYTYILMYIIYSIYNV